MKLKPIEELTDEELQAECDRRKVEQKAKDLIRRKDALAYVLANRTVLQKFMPPHAYGSCKTASNLGFHGEHGNAYCNLCTLMALTEYDDDIDIHICVEFTKVQE